MSASVNTALVQRRVARRPRVLDLLLFGELSLVVLAYNIYFILVRPIRGHLWDFVIFRNAGRRVIEGLSPYPAHATVALLHTRELFVYPPPMASYLFAPFAALPLVVAAAVYFFVVLPVNALVARARRGDAPPDPATKTCPECLSTIPIAARRCAFCTSLLPDANAKEAR